MHSMLVCIIVCIVCMYYVCLFAIDKHVCMYNWTAVVKNAVSCTMFVTKLVTVNFYRSLCIHRSISKGTQDPNRWIVWTSCGFVCVDNRNSCSKYFQIIPTLRIDTHHGFHIEINSAYLVYLLLFFSSHGSLLLSPFSNHSTMEYALSDC